MVTRIAAAPLLVLGGTLAQRRYGPAIGGRLVGLPLTSLPLLALITVANGRAFAAVAATATLAAVLAQSAWAWVYAHAAARSARVATPLALASGAFACCCLALYALHPSMLWGVTAGTLSILGALRWWPRTTPTGSPRAGTAADVGARMVAGGAFMLGVTEASRSLGASGAGFVGAYPVLTAVLTVATHRRDGADAASIFLRGVVEGSGSLVAGVATIALTISPLGPAIAFPLAIAAALLAQFAPAGVSRRPTPAAT